jgi:heme-degrading monooxygenase HmoA
VIIFINAFRVHANTAEFEQVFHDVSEFMTKKEGYRRHRLVKVLGAENRYFNIAEWDSEEALRSAAGDPEFEPHAQELRDRAVSEAMICAVIQDEQA